MTKDIFEKREIYLEEEYFGKKEFALLEKLRESFRRRSTRRAFARRPA